MIPIEEKGLEAYESGWKKAVELGIFNSWTAKMREALGRLNSELYPPLKEIGFELRSQGPVAAAGADRRHAARQRRPGTGLPDSGRAAEDQGTGRKRDTGQIGRRRESQGFAKEKDKEAAGEDAEKHAGANGKGKDKDEGDAEEDDKDKKGKKKKKKGRGR